MNATLSKVVIGLAAVLAFSAQANAATTNLGTLAVPSSVTIGNNVTAGSFTDSFNFTVANSAVNAALTSVSFGSAVGITGLSASLYNGANLLSSGTVGTSTLMPGVIVSGAVISPYALAAGSYTLKISGSGLAGGGSYGGNLNVVAAPVPEPTEGALLLSGIGLLGFIATRRKKA